MTKTVLIVEDDPNIRFALQALLEGEGYRVFQAENGSVALQFLEREGPLNVILLDMVMPEMDGWQFAREFSARYGTQAPLVVMTAAADAEQRAREVGAMGWIAKPFALGDLLALIRKHEKP